MSSVEVKTMFKNVQKIIFSKPFLISLILICLMFTSVSAGIDNAYAADLNESDGVGLEVDIENQLENSQENEITLASNQNEDVMQATHSLDGGTFKDIQKLVDKASNGDTIKLSGKFVSEGSRTQSQFQKIDFYVTFSGNFRR